MDKFIELFINGLALGAIYALVALGFVVIYRASEVFNFAHGEFMALGAFIMSSLASAGVPWLLALALSMGLTGALGAAVERGVLRHLVGRATYVPILMTIVVGLILRTLILLAWPDQPMGMPTPWERTATVQIFGTPIFLNSIAAVAAGALALGLFIYLTRYTRMGLAMRASASDGEAALALGIPVGRVLGVTWGLATAYAALAGIFLSMYPSNVESALGYTALRAFPAVIVGGLDSVLGTVIAGVLLGVLEVLSESYINPSLGNFGHGFHTVFPYIVMIVVLMVRPYGLFGTREVERV